MAIQQQLPNWLSCSAENAPDRLAISCGEVRWTLAELAKQARRLARQFASIGIHEGSRVALLATNGLPYVVSVHALTYLGALLVPLNVRLTLDELCWQVRDVHATHLLSDAQHEITAQQIKQAVPEVYQDRVQLQLEGVCLMARDEDHNIELHELIDLDKTQAIMYTSGTTGNPKGVIITYGMQWWNAVGSVLNLGHRADDCWLACMPLFHIGGLSILFRSVINGISVILHEKFDTAAISRAICEERVTIISVVAVMLQRMLTYLDDQGSVEKYPETLRCVLLGGGPAPRPLLEECAARGIPVVQTYGLTESCSQAATLAPADALRKLGSAGRPLLPVQLRVMNERDGQPAKTGEPGMICLKGPSITPGYADRPEATAQAIQDGWLATGDIGYLDEEGYLYVLDRRNDLIISGGENVYPAEIEAALLAHAAVAEAGVCGQPDAQWGQVPVAFVSLHAGQTVSLDELHAHVAQRLARYKRPREILVVEQLPRNSAGKLLRRELPQLFDRFSRA